MGGGAQFTQLMGLVVETTSLYASPICLYEHSSFSFWEDP